jgi:phosphatidylinositol glycan class C protein
MLGVDPDNYTDQRTFLEQLQRNPRLQPYDFWPLVADSTVIVQHVCSVIIFVVCFVGIFQERVSPVSVVTWGSIGTVLGWVLWDRWVGQEAAAAKAIDVQPGPAEDASGCSSSSSVAAKEDSQYNGNGNGNGYPLQNGHSKLSHNASTASLISQASFSSYTGCPDGFSTFAAPTPFPFDSSPSSFSPRNQQRLATAKSAVLIYCALLGLSPILKSLTKSTSSDSIWAMSCWLMIINVFFFDYGGGVGVKFPASLSTNAGLMASTVLASRLPSTQHVFSLTLFSIEVFGLFPVFRRHLRHVSWRGHLALTAFLVMGVGGGVAVVASGGGWTAALAGVVLGSLLTAFAMGGCSWWLISLQKYKNEIHGPWDPARPVIKRHWDGY